MCFTARAWASPRLLDLTLGILLLSLSVSEGRSVHVHTGKGSDDDGGGDPSGWCRSGKGPAPPRLKGRKQAPASCSLPGWGWHCPPPPGGSCKDKAPPALPGYLHLWKDNWLSLGQQWGEGNEGKKRRESGVVGGWGEGWGRLWEEHEE